MNKVKEALCPDGGLYSLSWYLAWTPGAERAILDGEFSAEELRGIADVMEGKTHD